MSRLFRSGHQLQFIIGTDVWPVLMKDEMYIMLEDEPDEQPVLQFHHEHGYKHVPGRFTDRGYIDIVSKEDNRIVGYLNLRTAEAVKFVSETMPLELSVRETIEFGYFLMALQRCRESVRTLAKVTDVLQLSDIIKTIEMNAIGKWFIDSTDKFHQRIYADKKIGRTLTTQEQIEEFFNDLFPRGNHVFYNVFQNDVAKNLYFLEHAMRWMEMPRLKLNYQTLGEVIPYQSKLQENVYSGEYRNDTPCEVVFPACVFAGTNDIVRQDSNNYKMMVCLPSFIWVIPKPPPGRINVDETSEADIIKFLRNLYKKLRQPREARYSIEIMRLFVDPVTLRQYMQGGDDVGINTIANASTKIQFYPLIIDDTQFDLVLILYKPFGSMLYSAELKKRDNTYVLELRYIADHELYTTAEKAAIAVEISRILVQLIEKSSHCYRYGSYPSHRVEGCKDCEKAQKSCKKVIGMMRSVTTKHYFYEGVESYPTVMDDYFTSDDSFSKID
jgi:hypothetical protein